MTQGTDAGNQIEPQAFEIKAVEFVKPYALIGPDYQATYYPVGSRA